MAILTVSDSRTAATDESGDAIRRLVEPPHELVGRGLSRDSIAAIRRAARRLLDLDPDVLIVNGGTGVAPRDVTVEALRAWMDKELPGFGERFRSRSAAEIGSGAWLSRATAGTVLHSGRRVLLFLLPGSPDAVRLALEDLILPELSHAVALAQGTRPSARGAQEPPAARTRPRGGRHA